ncbi:MAG: CRISPR system precrRNA processing endoribonuclease RAMP protein Cas6 [Armatimonadota bacterium]|nr:CRISPR system precrRNA processing endoribonuclease RAMP protein Cas6 [Armatimonadota bacterium]
MDWLQRIEVSRVLFSLECREPGQLPAYKGSMLRGATMRGVRELACAFPDLACSQCRLRTSCVYSHIFETPIEVMRQDFDGSHAPHPYVFEPPLDGKQDYIPGDPLDFSLLLVGDTVQKLPFLVCAVEQFERYGLGGSRLSFRLRSVSDEQGGSLLESTQGDVLPPRPLDLNSRLKDLLAGDALGMRFVTPLRIQHQGSIARNLDFGLLIRNLLRRISLLASAYGQPAEDYDYGSAIERASRAEVTASDLRWVDLQRYSNRQGRRMDYGGLVGTMIVDDHWREFAELLVLGEAVHVGKNTSFGLGQYQLLTGEEAISD